MLRVIKRQIQVIYAIFLRDMNRQFSSYKLGNVWLLLDPVLMIVLFMFLFGLRGRGEFGYIEPPLFILAAFLPFKHFFLKTMKECSNSVKSAKQLLFFNQIGFFDIVLARAFSIFVVGIVAGTIIAFLLYWIFGINSLPKDTLGVLFFVYFMSLIGFASGIILGMIQGVSKELSKVFDLMSLPLLVLSAVFFPMTSVPEPYRSYLAYNPLVHPMEFIRESWFDLYVSPVADFEYVAIFTICLLAFAMMLYRTRRHKVI